MTIIEAVASGKAFRRKAYEWGITWFIPEKYSWVFTVDDILANDWETVEDFEIVE